MRMAQTVANELKELEAEYFCSKKRPIPKWNGGFTMGIPLWKMIPDFSATKWRGVDGKPLNFIPQRIAPLR